MIKSLFFVLVATCITVNAYCQQAKKPTIMVVPDKNWCIRNGVTDELGNPDYNKALQDKEMSGLITAMGDIMAGYNYKLKLLSDCLDQLMNEEGLDMVLTSKGDGEIVETDLDKLTRVAQADILINLAYSLEKYGPRNMVEFNVVGVDAATSKQISGNVGHSSASSAHITDMLNEAVYGFMDNFCSKLNQHFDDIAQNGREGNVIFKMAEDCQYTFESEVYLNGESGELSEVIEYWFNENAVNGAFSMSHKTRNRLAFEEVRFPMFGESKFGGKPKSLDIQGFMRGIEGFLSQFNISCSFHPVGLGTVYIVLGSR